jgi:hypothetical protein
MTIETAVFAMTAIRARIHDALIQHLATDFPELAAEWQGPLNHDRRKIFCHALAPLSEPDELVLRHFASAIHTHIRLNQVVNWKVNTIQIYRENDYELYQAQESQIFSCTIIDVDHDRDWDPIEHAPEVAA